VSAGFHRAYARVRLLSVLRYFLRKQGMRDLGLPAAVPVAVLPVLVANVVRYQVLSRSRVGRRYRVWPDLGQISSWARFAPTVVIENSVSACVPTGLR
jgi:hypothetical protein